MKRMLRWAVLWGLMATTFGAPVHAAETIGTVIGVSDGDTLRLLTPSHRQIRVRLWQIDAPEKDQPFGQKAKRVLSDKVYRQQVTVESQTTDRYGRMIGQVTFEGRDINREMVAEGYAWAYRKYLKDRSLIAVEEAARKQQLGLWSLQADQRMPPWEWRYRQRQRRGH